MPSLLARARALFQSPADRRLAAAAAEAFSSAPAPSHALALRAANEAPGGMVPARSPFVNWLQDQPPAAPTRFTFTPGYNDATFQQFSAPLAFDGFDLARIRAAVTTHRIGLFWESSALMVAILSFAPVLAALQQAIAPILALPCHVHGGDKGLARMVADEVRDAFVPSGGLLPSPYLPPQLKGTLAIYLRMMGFGVLQHVDGERDPVTKVRPRWTRIWEPWAIQRYRSPRRTIALTTQGPIEVCNDGKFTLVEDEQEGHLSAAVCALGEETLAGKLTQEARNSWIDFFGKPKLYATLPEKVQTTGEAGDAFMSAVDTIYGPDGRGVLPYGSTLEAVSISGEGTKAFQDALLDAIIHIYMVLTGSAGTIGSGGPTGAGPYQPQKGGPWNVRHDLIARPTTAIVRAWNQGIVAPYCDINYGDAIDRAKRSGVWTCPVISIPIPAPDRDERIESAVKRYKALTDQVKAEREAGGIVDKDRVEKIASEFEVQPFTLAEQGKAPVALDLAPTDLAKVVRVDEARRSRGLPPIGGERGDLTIAELDALSKAGATETKREQEGGSDGQGSGDGDGSDSDRETGGGSSGGGDGAGQA